MKIKPKETYGNFCKRIRYACKFTQEQLAEEIGVSKSSIFLFESGKTPSLGNQRKIDEYAKTVK